MAVECPMGTAQAYIMMRDHAKQLERELNAAAEAGREMLRVLTGKSAGGIYGPSAETVQRWRNACAV